MIKAILACDQAWGIGKDNDLPWPRNSDDLKWFKETTTNSTIVMGRNTWESLPVKPLINRHNLIVSNTMKIQSHENVEIVRPDIYKSRMHVLSQTEPVWIIGGATLIMDCMDMIDEFHLSRIRGTYDCDTFLPSSLIEEQFSLTDSGLRGDVYIDVWSKR